MTAIEVNSHTSDAIYSVLITDPDDPQEAVCECRGYEVRGYCSHQQEAVDALCTWNELKGPEEQTNDQHRNKICPRCGERTEYDMELK